jgi:hypothetical protein
MLQPISLTEQLMYSTVRIQSPSGFGTGFVFTFKIKDRSVPVIITNKHVLDNNPQTVVKVHLHILDQNQNIETAIIDYQAIWDFSSSHDLCFTLLEPINYIVRDHLHKNLYFTSLQEESIPTEELLASLSAVEDILMVGYPMGIMDNSYSLPLFRKGITSSHPALKFDNQNIGIGDIACFPGSSGSPIMIVNEGIYTNKFGHTIIGQSRFIFLGVNFAGHTTINSNNQNNQYINTAIYIQSSQILHLRSRVEQLLRQHIDIEVSQA